MSDLTVTLTTSVDTDDLEHELRLLRDCGRSNYSAIQQLCAAYVTAVEAERCLSGETR